MAVNLPLESSATPIYASRIDYGSDINIAAQKIREYEEAKEELKNCQRCCSQILLVSHYLNQNLEGNPRDPRLPSAIRFVHMIHSKSTYAEERFRQTKSNLEKAKSDISAAEQRKRQLESGGVQRW